MKKTLLFLFLSTIILVQAQNTIKITRNENETLPKPIKIDKKSLLKIAENKTVLIYTFSIFCQPCILHLKNAVQLAKDYNVDFYVLLFQKAEKKEKAKTNKQDAIRYLTQNYKDIKILNISDKYGVSNRKSYKNFLTDITPKEFENINDFSKYILMKNGKVIMVTNYKDAEKYNDWKNDMPMLKEKIIPLLDKIKN